MTGSPRCPAVPLNVAAVIDRTANGDVIRKTGVMSIVIAGGDIRAGDVIRVELPPPPHAALQVV